MVRREFPKCWIPNRKSGRKRSFLELIWINWRVSDKMVVKMAAFFKRFLFTVLFDRKSTSSSGTRSLWRRMRDAKFPSGSPSRPSQQRRTTIKPPIRDGPNLRVVWRLQTFQNQWTSLVFTITRTKSRRCCCVTRNAVDLKNPASRKPTKATATSKLMGRKTQL